jgi:hypothetical protein
MSQIKTPISIRTFATDPNMLGLDLYPNQLKILESLYEKGTSRMVVAAGRRGGKSLISAVSTLYAAYIMQPIFASALAPGEPFYCMVISATADQASRLLKRIRALIGNHSSMSQEIKSESATSIELYNGAIITSQTYSARGSVGNAVAHLVCDEMGRWMASGNHTNVDATEVLQAVTPSLAQFPKSRQLFVSTPWLQSGEFHRLYQLSQSPDCPQGLVSWHFSSQQLNPTITDEWIKQERQLMGDKYVRAEYYGMFESTDDKFLDSHVIDMAVRREPFSMPDSEYAGEYVLSLDAASGSSSRDAFAAVLLHADKDRNAIVDFFHEFKVNPDRGEVSFEDVKGFIRKTHRDYKLGLLVADQHESKALLEEMGNELRGVRTYLNHWTQSNHTTQWSTVQYLFGTERISLPQHDRAISQLKGLTQHFKPNGAFKVSGDTMGSHAVDDLGSAMAQGIGQLDLENRNEFVSNTTTGLAWAL